jgi:hypothetical protein
MDHMHFKSALCKNKKLNILYLNFTRFLFKTCKCENDFVFLLI